MSTWFYASLIWLFLAYAGLVFGGPSVALAAVVIAGWCFAVWTVAIGVRVGQRVENRADLDPARARMSATSRH